MQEDGLHVLLNLNGNTEGVLHRTPNHNPKPSWVRVRVTLSLVATLVVDCVVQPDPHEDTGRHNSTAVTVSPTWPAPTPYPELTLLCILGGHPEVVDCHPAPVQAPMRVMGRVMYYTHIWSYDPVLYPYMVISPLLPSRACPGPHEMGCARSRTMVITRFDE